MQQHNQEDSLSTHVLHLPCGPVDPCIRSWWVPIKVIIENVGSYRLSSNEQVVQGPRVMRDTTMTRLPQAEASGIGQSKREVWQADGDKHRLWMWLEVDLLKEENNGEGKKGDICGNILIQSG